MLYFCGSYLANLSGYIEWVLFVLGIVLLVVEVYILPGFGIAGAAGIGLMVGSLFFALMNLAPDGGLVINFSGLRLEAFKRAFLTLLSACLLLVPGLYLVGRLMPSMRSFQGMVLDPEPSDIATEVEVGKMDPVPSGSVLNSGDEGIAVTDLHPAGLAEFSGWRKDVLTEGFYLEKGSPIRIIRVSGGQIFVGPADDSG